MHSNTYRRSILYFRCVCVCVCVCVCLSVCTFICVQDCVRACKRVCVCVRARVYEHANLCVCACAHTGTCVYTLANDGARFARASGSCHREPALPARLSPSASRSGTESCQMTVSSGSCVGAMRSRGEFGSMSVVELAEMLLSSVFERTWWMFSRPGLCPFKVWPLSPLCQRSPFARCRISISLGCTARSLSRRERARVDESTSTLVSTISCDELSSMLPWRRAARPAASITPKS